MGWEGTSDGVGGDHHGQPPPVWDQSRLRWVAAECSLMLMSPVLIHHALWTMRSMMASAWTPPPRRACQSFFAYWVANTVEPVCVAAFHEPQEHCAQGFVGAAWEPLIQNQRER